MSVLWGFDQQKFAYLTLGIFKNAAAIRHQTDQCANPQDDCIVKQVEPRQVLQPAGSENVHMMFYSRS